MYQVFVETAPLDEDIDLAKLAVQTVEVLNDSRIAHGAVIGTNLQRHALDMTCSIDNVSDARIAITLAAAELEAQLERLGVPGVRITHAEADPQRITGGGDDAFADIVTSSEAAEVVGVSRQRFNDLSHRGGFPPALGRIGKALVYSRAAIEAWRNARPGAEKLMDVLDAHVRDQRKQRTPASQS